MNIKGIYDLKLKQKIIGIANDIFYIYGTYKKVQEFLID
jgi:hypothetical protein